MGTNDVVFISPYRGIYRFDNIDNILRRIKQKFFKSKEILQINLDNCTIQRMEKLNENSTLEDVKNLGLYPLYLILKESPNIYLCPLGVHEMPGSRIAEARRGYELFCKKFWPTHINDPRATSLIYDGAQDEINFHDLSEDKKYIYGSWYLTYLLIQKIIHCYHSETPVNKFTHYIYGIIYYLDTISAFELEVAKYAFWDISEKELHNLPEEIRDRRQVFKKNFTKSFTESRSNFEKTKKSCMNAAVDTFHLMAIQLLSSNSIQEDLGNGYKITEHLLATTDEKLYKSANVVTPIPISKEFGYSVEIKREEELKKFEYWRTVDDISKNILQDRMLAGYNIMPEQKFSMISKSIIEIEKDLETFFNYTSM